MPTGRRIKTRPTTSRCRAYIHRRSSRVTMVGWRRRLVAGPSAGSSTPIRVSPGGRIPQHGRQRGVSEQRLFLLVPGHLLRRRGHQLRNGTFMSPNGNFPNGALAYFTVPTFPAMGILGLRSPISIATCFAGRTTSGTTYNRQSFWSAEYEGFWRERQAQPASQFLQPRQQAESHEREHYHQQRRHNQQSAVRASPRRVCRAYHRIAG